MLFNIFINDLFLFIKEAELANFADDNTIYATCKNVTKLLDLLQKECKTAIEWFKNNNMIVNPGKFQAMILGTGKDLQDKYTLNINGAEIISEASVKLLGIEIGSKLNFENHVSSLCKKASNQLNALSRIQNFLGQKEKETIINSFIYSNFNYCSLVWHFCTRKAEKKVEKIQERCLKIILNDYSSSYEDLLRKSENVTMEIKRFRTLAIEVFKILNDLNPKFMKEIFHYSPHSSHK